MRRIVEHATLEATNCVVTQAMDLAILRQGFSFPMKLLVVVVVDTHIQDQMKMQSF